MCSQKLLKIQYFYTADPTKSSKNHSVAENLTYSSTVPSKGWYPKEIKVKTDIEKNKEELEIMPFQF